MDNGQLTMDNGQLRLSSSIVHYFCTFRTYPSPGGTLPCRTIPGVAEPGHPPVTPATGALHKVSSPYELAQRSEYRANRYAAQHFLTVEDFLEAFRCGCREAWELAEYFDLPEQDVKNALTYWTERRGVRFDRPECS